MNNYFDKWGRIHNKPTPEGSVGSTNNGWIFTAYLAKAGYKVDLMSLAVCFKECKQVDPTNGRVYLIRSPLKDTPPMSRDEILGMASLGFLRERHINNWNFSPYPVPAFNLFKLFKQLKEAKDQHRNYFWLNKLDQLYRLAFSVPLQDRAFLLECFGEKNSLRYFFYKAIAYLDSKFAKPKNGIHWLKYGGEERKKFMQQDFPEDHLLRKL
jgi:hypothetical protein